MPIIPTDKTLWLQWTGFLCSVLFCLLCILNLISFHGRQEIYLKKYNYYLSYKKLTHAQHLYNSVSQVQNQLTDISATLGMDHLDQGFDRAKKAAEIFQTGVNNLRHLIAKEPVPETIPLDLTALENRFEHFYALGIQMANAYIQSGTWQGNQKMRLFDAEADALRGILAQWLASLEQQTSHWQNTIQHSATDFVAPSGVTNFLWLHLMGTETRAHYIQFMTHWIQSAPKEDQRMELSSKAQELQGYVIHVQQWLTDLAATRGRDGLDEGLGQARQGAASFQSELPAFLSLVEKTGHQDWINKTSDLQQRFAAFHTKGQALATAYIQGGAKQGNLLMSEFDTMADDLENDLLPFITPAIQAAFAENYQMDLIHHSLQDIRKALFFLLFLSLLALPATLLWLVSCLRSQNQTPMI
ncbi:MAG: hypothetical protein H7839_03740 [Magnetococcus sp. YQC-5]